MMAAQSMDTKLGGALRVCAKIQGGRGVVIFIVGYLPVAIFLCPRWVAMGSRKGSKRLYERPKSLCQKHVFHLV